MKLGNQYFSGYNFAEVLKLFFDEDGNQMAYLVEPDGTDWELPVEFIEKNWKRR